MIGIRKKFPTRMVVTSMAIAIPLYSWIMYANGLSLEKIAIVMGTTILVAVTVCLVCAVIIRRNREKN
jgi:hypothetical protein